MILTDEGPVYCDGEPRFSNMMQKMLDGLREDTRRKFKRDDDLEIQKIMAAYDRRHSSWSQDAKAVEREKLLV